MAHVHPYSSTAPIVLIYRNYKNASNRAHARICTHGFFKISANLGMGTCIRTLEQTTDQMKIKAAAINNKTTSVDENFSTCASVRRALNCCCSYGWLTPRTPRLSMAAATVVMQVKIFIQSTKFEPAYVHNLIFSIKVHGECLLLERKTSNPGTDGNFHLFFLYAAFLTLSENHVGILFFCEGILEKFQQKI